MTDTKERLEKDIADAFDFFRYLVKHPRMLAKVKDGAEIEFVPEVSHRLPAPPRRGKNIQPFRAETVFHSL